MKYYFEIEMKEALTLKKLLSIKKEMEEVIQIIYNMLDADRVTFLFLSEDELNNNL